MTTLVFIGAFCIVAVFVYMARYSGRLRVARTRVIDAPIDTVFSRVSDFRQWQSWCPWLDVEPEMKITQSGKGCAEGNCLEWEGKRSASGRIQHIQIKTGECIDQKIRCKQPFRVTGRFQWLFVDRNGKTEVTWTFVGRVGFSLRAFATTVQSMFDIDYRYALDRLASQVEPADARRYQFQFIGLQDIPANNYRYIKYDGPINGVTKALQTSLAKLRDSQAIPAMDSDRQSVAIYLRTNIKLRTTACRLGVLLGDSESSQLPVHEMPAHSAYVVRLEGAPEALEIAWYQAMQRMRVENIQPDQRIPPFEVYRKDPRVTPENDFLVDVHVPAIRKA